jgi:hypothetical protein
MANLAENFFIGCRNKGGVPKLVEVGSVKQVDPYNFQYAIYAAGLYRFYCDGKEIDPRDGMWGLDYGDGVLYGYSGQWMEVTKNIVDPPWKKFVKPVLIGTIALTLGATAWIIFEGTRKEP